MPRITCQQCAQRTLASNLGSQQNALGMDQDKYNRCHSMSYILYPATYNYQPQGTYYNGIQGCVQEDPRQSSPWSYVQDDY
jgi:hypothetical protein